VLDDTPASFALATVATPEDNFCPVVHIQLRLVSPAQLCKLVPWVRYLFGMFENEIDFAVTGVSRSKQKVYVHQLLPTGDYQAVQLTWSQFFEYYKDVTFCAVIPLLDCHNAGLLF
jgi:hypothetical protein